MPGLFDAVFDAVWNAVNAWNGVPYPFKHSFRFNAEQSGLWNEFEPALSDLPTIAIEPGNSTAAFIANRQKRISLVFKFIIWTPNFDFQTSGFLVEQLIDAIYKSHPEASNQSYIEAAGYQIDTSHVSTLSQARVLLGKKKATQAIRTEWTEAVKVGFDPFR
jgi:hypothetical protein